MKEEMKRNIEQLIEELREGTLTEEHLRQGLEAVEGMAPKRQSLLYLQANKTSVTSPVLGMALVTDGEASDGPADPDDWPYQTVLEAMNDGWRIIKFPEMALLLDEKRTYGLGCEFILEKWE